MIPGFVVKCLNSSNQVVKSVARHDVYFQRMHSTVGHNAQYCASVFGVSLDRVAEINKKAAWSLCNGVWMTHSDIYKVKVISELLCIRHSYVQLECINSEDIDFMIEFMCTD